jgi:hypothetical protein
METLLGQAKTSSSPLSVVPLLGLSVDVAARLKIPAHQRYRDIPVDVKACASMPRHRARIDTHLGTDPQPVLYESAHVQGSRPLPCCGTLL